MKQRTRRDTARRGPTIAVALVLLAVSGGGGCKGTEPPPEEPTPSTHCGDPAYAQDHQALCFGGCKDPELRATPACVPCVAAPDDPLCAEPCVTGGCDTDTDTEPTGTTGEPTGGTDTGTGTPPGDAVVVQLALTQDTTCGRLSTGAVKCWGGTTDGLGYGNQEDIGDDELPADVGEIELGGVAIDLSSGDQHVCALLETGGVRCWGRNDFGQLGLGFGFGTVGLNDVPADWPEIFYNPSAADPLNDPPPPNAPRGVQISAGSVSTCVLLDDGTVWCWGLGLMVGGPLPTPIGDDEHASAVPPKAFPVPIEQISAGGGIGCVLTTTGSVRCWGEAVGFNHANLGYAAASPVPDHALAPDVMIGDTVQEIAHGHGTTCTITDSNAAHCWGNNFWGQLGLGHTNDIGDNEHPVDGGPAALGGPVKDVCSGQWSTCAVHVDGTVRCFGENGAGTLGYGHTDPIGDDELPETEAAIDFGREAVSIECGNGHVCAILEDGAVRCWGRNHRGQLGLGHTMMVTDADDPAVPDVEVL